MLSSSITIILVHNVAKSRSKVDIEIFFKIIDNYKHIYDVSVSIDLRFWRFDTNRRIIVFALVGFVTYVS